MTSTVSLWGLDPLFHTYRKVFVRALKSRTLRVVDIDNHFEFFYCNRPCQLVEICGIITARKKGKNFVVDKGTTRETQLELIIFVIDDGSASIQCSVMCNPRKVNYTQINKISIGDLVFVKGSLRMQHPAFGNQLVPFNELHTTPREVTVNIKSIETCDDPNLEMHHWLMSMQLHDDVYSKQFVYKIPADQAGLASLLHSGLCPCR